MKKNENKHIMAIFIGVYILLIIYTIFIQMSMKDKEAYINGLRSQKAVCDGQLETVKQDYRKLTEELEKLKGDE